MGRFKQRLMIHDSDRVKIGSFPSEGLWHCSKTLCMSRHKSVWLNLGNPPASISPIPHHICVSALTMPAVKPAVYNYFWRCISRSGVSICSRCLKEKWAPRLENGKSSRIRWHRKMVRKWSRQRDKHSPCWETHFVWNVVLEMVIQLAPHGCSQCFTAYITV